MGYETVRQVWRGACKLGMLAFACLPPTSVHARSANELKVLTYNVYMRPTTLFKNGQMTRAALLPSVLSGYDAIVFQEAFSDKARGKLLSGLEGEYPFRTDILGADAGVGQDGGVIIVSRWPIIRQSQSIFEVCGGSDCFAQKGVMYALLNKEGRCYHLFGTHVQAGVEKWPVRVRQFQAIRDFVASAHIRSDEPVIIAGDLNEDRYGERYREMLDRMEAGPPHHHAGPAYTVSPEANDLNDGRYHRYYDYVLYSRNHLQPVSSLNEVRVLRSAERWRGYPWARWHLDLSDHYAVFGRYAFPPTAGLPCPSAEAYRDLSIAGPSRVSAGTR